MDYFNQESKRLIYRKLKESDVKSWAEFFIDNPNLPFLGIPQELSLAEMPKVWIDIQFERYAESGFGGLASVCKETGELIGISGISLKEIHGQTEYEIMYALKPEYWRQGYASEMSAMFKQFAIDNKINHRVISIIHKDNIGSQKVAEKNRMRILFETEYKEMPCLVYGVEI